MVPTTYHRVRRDHRVHEALLLSRDWASPLGVSSPLYIFLGILILLCVAAPVLSYQRHLRQSSLAEQTCKLHTAVASEREKTAEVAALHALQAGRELAETELRNQLREERGRVQAAELRELTLAARKTELEVEMVDMRVMVEEVRTERRKAEEETGEVRIEYETAMEKVGELEERLVGKEEALRALRRQIGIVNQESLMSSDEVKAGRGAAL